MPLRQQLLRLRRRLHVRPGLFLRGLPELKMGRGPADPPSGGLPGLRPNQGELIPSGHLQVTLWFEDARRAFRLPAPS